MSCSPWLITILDDGTVHPAPQGGLIPRLYFPTGYLAAGFGTSVSIRPSLAPLTVPVGLTAETAIVMASALPVFGPGGRLFVTSPVPLLAPILLVWESP